MRKHLHFFPPVAWYAENWINPPKTAPIQIKPIWRNSSKFRTKNTMSCMITSISFLRNIEALYWLPICKWYRIQERRLVRSITSKKKTMIFQMIFQMIYSDFVGLTIPFLHLLNIAVAPFDRCYLFRRAISMWQLWNGRTDFCQHYIRVFACHSLVQVQLWSERAHETKHNYWWSSSCDLSIFEK